MSEINVKKVTFGDNGEQVQPAFTGFRNKIINGCFRVWQRDNTQTTSGYGSDDRWTNQNLGTTKTHSRQSFTLGQSEVPGNPEFFSRTVVSSVAGVGNYCLKQQKIEYVRTLSGKTAVLSFWAKADAVKNIAVDFAQNFGTGGSPSATVIGIGVLKFALGTTWQRYSVVVNLPSISGKTLGTDNNDYLLARIWFDAGSNYNADTNTLGQQSGTFDIAQVQLEEGSVATEFEDRPIGIEEQLCHRYFYMLPNYLYGYPSPSSGSYMMIQEYTFPVAMRVYPAMTWSYGASSNLSAVNTQFITRWGVTVQYVATAMGNCTWTLQNSYANSEL